MANLKQLIEHRRHLSECTTFEGFKEIQLAFLDLIINSLRQDEADLREHARVILQGEPE
jgi:hypothetical protein